MAGITIKCAAQGFIAVAVRAHTAAAIVRHGHHAIDMRILFQFAGIGEVLGNRLGDSRGAIHSGEYANVIARADFTVNALVTLKGCAFIGRNKFGGFCFFAEAVVFFQFAHRTVVHMHMLARWNVLAGKTNGLAVFKNGFALGDVAHSYFVHGGDVAREGHIFFCKQNTGGQRYLANAHVITVMQNDNAAHADLSFDSLTDKWIYAVC